MKNKITVIHHSADFDGLFCREIAKKFLPGAELIGWDYGDPLIPMPPEGIVYILDLSPDSLGGDTYDSSRIIWIDHHKTAIDKYPATIPGYRIDGVAACRLAWQWFNLRENPAVEVQLLALPEKGQFISRDVYEPYAVRLAGEHDIWDHRDPNASVFQMGLRSIELNDNLWSVMLGSSRKMSIREIETLMEAGHPPKLNPDGTVDESGWLIQELLKNGKMLQDYQQRCDLGSMKSSFIAEFEGCKFLCLNTPSKGGFVFASKDVPETGHDALLKFNWTGSVWDCSMYHAKGMEEIDLSIIAKKYGGGGHRGACGFRSKILPFLS